MKKITLTVALFLILLHNSQAQTTTSLTANGSGNTYEDINAVLAPNGGDVIEAPGITPTDDCSNHDSFDNGESTNANRHIQEVTDPEMGNVFKFSVHVDEDIDRDKCSTTDRQRNEIKTYATSPDYLLGTIGETVEYKWSFKIPAGFQSSSSFTHIHQLKSVGGLSDEEKIPMITLTIYDNSSGHKLYIRYSATSNDQTTISGHNVNISDLENNWVEVIETVTYGMEGEGSYAIEITDIDTQNVLLSYSDATKRYYKTDADFMRPKWGIYRSLNSASSLRNEEILYGSFTITEIAPTVLSNEDFIDTKSNVNIYPNPSSDFIYLPFTKEETHKYSVEIYNTLGKLVREVPALKSTSFSIKNLPPAMYYLKLTNTEKQVSVTKKITKL